MLCSIRVQRSSAIPGGAAQPMREATLVMTTYETFHTPVNGLSMSLKWMAAQSAP